MTRIQPYHFTKDIGKDFNRFFENVVKCNGIVCFDFEDSISTPDQNQLPALKHAHRKTVTDKLADIAPFINLGHIGFRINGTNTAYYAGDLEAISKLKNVNCVFLPKAETRSQIEGLLMDLPLSVKEIIPIIETRKGFENIEQILSVNDQKFRKIAFGHCDFNLSNHHFPFFHQDSAVYWNWIARLSDYTASAGKELINSPVLELDNDAYFSRILQKNSLYKSITGQVTLCYNQTYLCAHPEIQTGSLLGNDPENKTGTDLHALKIIETFEQYKIADKGFAIDQNRILISPQEYSRAKSLIKENTL